MRPKGLTAESFGRNFGQFSAETVSALLAGFGHSAVIKFSAENSCFGRKWTVSAENVSFGTNYLIKYGAHGTLLNQPYELSMLEELNFGRNSQFSAEIVIFGRKFPYGRNFGYSRISAFSSYFFRFRCFGKKYLSVTH